ncbi:MAG: lipid IV(A) 3-deoxy-D-manno-octulosonic acid transferase [Gammaproteobacteria bacterium]|nr:lipid IV(A) 3-deoxy-D-manno-octulosonic acid transferase [Gammaproteobacteria bacterium]
MRLLYTLGFYLAVPALLLRWLWRSRRNVGYRQRLGERFGFIKFIPKTTSIWLHAVSLGEAIAAAPLIKALLHNYPDYTIVVTSTTPTGSNQIQKQFGKQVYHCYLPLDLPMAMSRFLTRIRPKLAIIMETELWPNLLSALKAKNIPVLIANARLSKRSMHNYKKIQNTVKKMLGNVNQVIAQSELDGEHFLKLGLKQHQLTIGGNIKFDMTLPDDIKTKGQAMRAQWHSESRPTFIVASTHEGEESLIVDAFKIILQKFPNTLLILAPRHPERFAKVISLFKEAGFNIALRSSNDLISNNTQVLIGDTLGELRQLYATADVALVAGSLAPIGGHNLIEPAALGMPILAGPNLQNCLEISKTLLAKNALKITPDAKTISDTVIELFNQTELANTMGIAAKQVADDNRGALQRHLDGVESILS